MFRTGTRSVANFFLTPPNRRGPYLHHAISSKGWRLSLDIFASSPLKSQYRNFQQGFRPGPGRYQRSTNIFQRWAARPTFYYECAGLGGTCAGFYIYNLEEVPISGRRRFNIVSAEYEQQTGEQLYQQTLEQYRGRILPERHKLHQLCERVLERLIPHTGLKGDETQWELHVIADDQTNAFVIPGGKVFVFTGILNVCQNEDGLAAVLGHEIAHNIAHHSAERMSQYGILLPVAAGISVILGFGDFINISRLLVDLCFLRPGSRTQESEADHIGLMMMAEACYDPKAAIDLWTRMDKMAEAAPPQFLSTHPSNYARREAIRGWLEQAESKKEAAGCGPTAAWAGDFHRVTSRRV